MAAPGPERFTWRKSPVHPDGQHEVLLKVKQTRQQCKLSCQMNMRTSSHKHKLEMSVCLERIVFTSRLLNLRFCSMASIHDDSSVLRRSAKHEQQGSKET